MSVLSSTDQGTCVYVCVHLCTCAPSLYFSPQALFIGSQPNNPKQLCLLSTTELFFLTRKSVRRPGRTFSHLMAMGMSESALPFLGNEFRISLRINWSNLNVKDRCKRKNCLFIPQAKQMPSHCRLSGRVEIMRYFETVDIVRKTDIGERAEVVSDYFSEEQWNTKWVSVWVKQRRWEKEVLWIIYHWI